MSRPAVFLDRSGTLIQEPDYPLHAESVELTPGTGEALHALRQAGFLLVVVTNQSGIARGLFSEEEYREVATRVDRLLAGVGARPDRTEYCPHDPRISGPCTCRKPGTGMHLRAAAALKIDLARSWCVGDQVRDVLPARTLEMAGALLVRTGHGAEEALTLPPGVRAVDDLRAAAREIVAQARGSSS